MDQAYYLRGIPISLLIERMFWIGIGIFLGAAILRSLLSSIHVRQEPKANMEQKLKSIAKNATQSND